MTNLATAKVIADSIYNDKRITTLQLRYWRAIHSEMNTHRIFSRSAGSSRARPIPKIIDQVYNNPWGPIHWGANKKGMQATQEIADIELAKKRWLVAAKDAANNAEDLMELGLHKQIVNRILEPFTYIDVVVTSTEWDNFFELRDHFSAQPEIRQLAQAMKEAMKNSEPKELDRTEWHLPYIYESDFKLVDKYLLDTGKEITPYAQLFLLRKMSTARCARVSYNTFEDTKPTIEQDLELYDKLITSKPIHASPAEHQATPLVHKEDSIYCGNFKGWIQHRKLIEA